MKRTQKHTPIKRPFVLSIAGLDPSSGAGLTADIKTMERLKCYGLSVSSGNTVQNDKELSAVYWTPIDIMKAQIDLLFDRFEIDYVKVGIIESWSILNKIITYLKLKNSGIKVILDPVLTASSSFKFHSSNEQDFFEVLKNIYLITPNYLEFEKLAIGSSHEQRVSSITDHCHLLLKGGHQPVDPNRENEKESKKGKDELYLTTGKNFVFNPKRIAVFEKHGSGCILSSSITSFLALDNPLNKACYKAKKYTENILSSNKSLLAYHF
jgi:hydroxymethylpyrimidine/phosphomethylpyrimidine kinase